jgi:DNA processing protein
MGDLGKIGGKVPTDPGVDALHLAIAVVRYGHGPRRVASQLRQQGPRSAYSVYGQLTDEQCTHVDHEARALAAAGAEAVLLGQGRYPQLLASLRQAPAALFYRGNADLLEIGSIGICGSRDASSQGLSAAYACGDEVARCGLAVVSGYARGVDTQAHSAALDAGGRTVMVLAEGIARFKAKRWLAARSYDPMQAAVVSQFPPSQAWSAGGAMSRNSVIIGLSLGMVVIEAGETGGTLAAGMQALDERRPVIALEFRHDIPAGNKILLDHGAVAVRSREQLRERLRQILAGNYPGQPTLV